MLAIEKLKEMSKEDLLGYLTNLEESEDRLFQDSAKILLALSEEGDIQIRKKAIDLLWDEACPEVYIKLRKWAEEDPDSEVRNRAIIGLGRYVYEGDLEMDSEDLAEMEGFEDEVIITDKEYGLLRQFLIRIHNDESKSLDERRYALEALSFASEEEVLELINKAYNSSEKDMKISSIFAMGRNGLLKWKSIILEELGSKDKEILLEAIKAAGAMNLESAGKQLLELSRDDDKDIVLNSIYALGFSGWEGAFDRLKELSTNKDEYLSSTAEEALNEWVAMNEFYSDEDEEELELE